MNSSNTRQQPALLVFAGPNGSGKSVLSRSFEIKGLYINADEIKKHDSKISDLDAAVEAESLREHCLSAKKDFTFETVLSTSRNLDLIARAKNTGYSISSVFVLTADPKVNIFRIKTRVLNGGHDVPDDKVLSRYKKSLDNIPALTELSDEIYIFDNTEEPFIIYLKDNAGNDTYSVNKYWTKTQIASLINAE